MQSPDSQQMHVRLMWHVSAACKLNASCYSCISP